MRARCRKVGRFTWQVNLIADHENRQLLNPYRTGPWWALTRNGALRKARREMARMSRDRQREELTEQEVPL